MRRARPDKQYVEGLPYRILRSIYKNSRASLRELGRSLGISYHTISNTLNQLDERYKICYTVELDENQLGFTEGRIITIKFEKRPEIDLLKKMFSKDAFIQDAYLAEGDFDLLLYVLGLTQVDFQSWQFDLRVKFEKYKPIFTFSVLNAYPVGFFPIKSDLISKSIMLTHLEKKVLILLNENSRIKFGELVRKSGASQMRIIYIIKKLREKHILKKFTALTQSPDKKLIEAYCTSLIPTKAHNKLLLSLSKEILEEDMTSATNDYAIIASTNGTYDAVHVCNFANGESLTKRGSTLLQNVWANEHPKIDRAMLTDVITGKWPFHLEEYTIFKDFVKKSERSDDLPKKAPA